MYHQKFYIQFIFISILLLSYAFKIFHCLVRPRHAGVSLSPGLGTLGVALAALSVVLSSDLGALGLL